MDKPFSPLLNVTGECRSWKWMVARKLALYGQEVIRDCPVP
jgi:hypothetical protein